jgi:multidrug resistance efflux pump
MVFFLWMPHIPLLENAAPTCRAADSPDPLKGVSAVTLPSSKEEKTPAKGPEPGDGVRQGATITNEPWISQRLTRELSRLLHPEQTPTRAQGTFSSSPVPGPEPIQEEPSGPEKEASSSPEGNQGTLPHAPPTQNIGASASSVKAPSPPTVEPVEPVESLPHAPLPPTPPKTVTPALPTPALPKTRLHPAGNTAEDTAGREKKSAAADARSIAATPVTQSRESPSGSQSDKTTAPPARRRDETRETPPLERESSLKNGARPAEKTQTTDVARTDGKDGETVEMIARQNIVRAEVKPVNLMVLSAPHDGVIAAVSVRDGDSVDEGQRMVSFDTRAEEQSRTLADALAADAFNRLGTLPEGPSRERDELAAEYLRHSTQVRVHEHKLARSAINASFAGTVTEVYAKAGEHVKEGAPIVEIAESGSLEIVCRVPSAWVRWLKPGHIVWMYVEETAKSYEAVLVRLGGKVDANSKTLRAYARFSTPPTDLLPGMSGSASIRPQRADEQSRRENARPYGGSSRQNGTTSH